MSSGSFLKSISVPNDFTLALSYHLLQFYLNDDLKGANCFCLNLIFHTLIHFLRLQNSNFHHRYPAQSGPTYTDMLVREVYSLLARDVGRLGASSFLSLRSRHTWLYFIILVPIAERQRFRVEGDGHNPDCRWQQRARSVVVQCQLSS